MLHQTTPNQSFKIENVLLLILLCVGLCGFYYTYNSPNEPTQTVAWGQSGKISSDIAGENWEKLDNVALEVEGIREAGMPVEFFIQGYNELAEFVLDLGNGQKLKATGEKLSFTYPESGHYQVSLLVSYEGSRQLLHQETLKIRGENLVAGR